MVRHVVLMRFREDSPPGTAATVVQGLKALPPQIPEIRAMSVGEDLGVVPNGFDLAIVVDFATSEDYLVYANHHAHRQVVEGLIDPFVIERNRAQIEVPG
ncbi:MAG TPA: Dabb family protein [Candidatus Dormibacteraeota bacterium]|nr:Dabb family protein [Candidatus Dormibacteraeota bacterium]